MSFAYFGANGTYSMTDTTTSAATQMIDTTTNVWGSSAYGGLLGNIGAANYGNYVQQGLTNQATTASSLQEFMDKVAKPAKKAAKGILAKLQAEIDDWHGDILERCPA